MRTRRSLPHLAGFMALGCAACGGGGGDGGGGSAPTPKFTSTDDVAAAYAQTGLSVTTLVGDYGVLGNSGTSSTADATSTKQLSPASIRRFSSISPLTDRMQRTLGSGKKVSDDGTVPKAASTSSCSKSGTQSFPTDDTTIYDHDGTNVYSQCVEAFTNSDGSEYERRTTDGQASLKCTDAGQSKDSCAGASYAYGSGSSAPLSLAVKDADGSRDNVTTLNLKVDYLSTADQLTKVRGDGSVRFVDNRAGRTIGISYSGLSYVEDGSSQQSTLTIDGQFAVTGDLAKCTKLPSVKVATPQKLQAGSGSPYSSGQLSFTDPSGQTAQMVFTSTGASVTVGGLSQAYTYDQLATFCN